MRNVEEFIWQSPHECLAHISEDNCELILRASGSFDNRQFVHRRCLRARCPVWIQDPAELWLNQMLFSQTVVTQAGCEWSRKKQSLKRFYIALERKKTQKPPSVNYNDAIPPSLSEGRLHHCWDRDVWDGSKYTRGHFCSHALCYWVHCKQAPDQVQMICLVSAKESIATWLSPERRRIPMLTHAHARTKHMTCCGLISMPLLCRGVQRNAGRICMLVVSWAGTTVTFPCLDTPTGPRRLACLPQLCPLPVIIGALPLTRILFAELKKQKNKSKMEACK